MTFYLIGIDHNRVDLNIRECANRSRKEMEKHVEEALRGRGVLLSTCNRIELYGVADDELQAAQDIELFRETFLSYFKNAYTFIGQEQVFKYSLSLACGLRSQLKGESQILTQLETWISKEDFPEPLSGLWRDVIDMAKKVRHRSGLDKVEIDIARLACNDLASHGFDKDSATIMIIGTGKVAQLIVNARPLFSHLVFVAHKRRLRAERLARVSNGEVISHDRLPGFLTCVDAVICATSSPHYILNKAHFKEALKVRKRELYIYDLAVPRDLSPDLKGLPGLIIKDMDILVKDYYRRDDKINKQLALAQRIIESLSRGYKDADYKDQDKHRYAPQQSCYQAI